MLLIWDIFNGCLSLSSLTDISKWSTKNVINMNGMLYEVHPYHQYLIFQNGILIKLLVWVIYLMVAHHYYLFLIFKNVTDMNYILGGCSSILSLPDISK